MVTKRLTINLIVVNILSMKEQLEAKAQVIWGTKDGEQIEALEKGKLGHGRYFPPANQLEAYKVGLDLYFNSLNLEEFSAEEVVQKEDWLLKEGFFDRFQVPMLYKESNDPEELAIYKKSRNKYQGGLKVWDKCKEHKTINEEQYSSYIKGSLVALKVWELMIKNTIQKKISYGLSEKGVVEKRERKAIAFLSYSDLLKDIQLEREELLEKIGEKKVKFTPQELNSLNFIKYLIEKGKMTS